MPDVLVEDPNNPTEAGVKEADLERHLSNPNEKPTDAKPAPKTESKSVKPAEPKPSQTVKPGDEKVDFQMDQALNQLKGLPVILKPQAT